jgi:toxin secretion/phage lysis holin
METANQVFVYLMGEPDKLLYAFFITLGLNWFIAIITSWIRGIGDSDKGLKSILKKVVYILVLILMTVMDDLFGLKGVSRSAYIYGIIATQLSSIYENVTGASISLPDIFKQIMGRLQGSKPVNVGVKQTSKKK